MLITDKSRAHTRLDQLGQLLTVTWDGSLLSKASRDELVSAGYAYTLNGWNSITENGIILLVNLGYLSKG